MRRDVKRSEWRIRTEMHAKFVERCGAAGVDLNAAVNAFVEAVVNGSITLQSPKAVKVQILSKAGELLGVDEVSPHAKSKREALRRIAAERAVTQGSKAA